MRKETYDKMNRIAIKYQGYVRTVELLSEGITNRQIAEFVEAGVAQKVSSGIYWIHTDAIKKPTNYRMIEVALVNPKAVICAESACYVWELITDEPDSLAVATKRTDRSNMMLNFPTSRHYLSEQHFEEEKCELNTKYGKINLYSIDRSVCECIYFRNDIEQKIYEDVIKSYLVYPDKDMDVLLKHANHLRIGNIVNEELVKFKQLEATPEVTERKVSSR